MLQGLTVICDNKKPDGTVCGATAIVVRAAYEYDNVDFVHPDPAHPLPTLKETRYEIECPNCGHRAQAEKAEPPK